MKINSRFSKYRYGGEMPTYEMGGMTPPPPNDNLGDDLGTWPRPNPNETNLEYLRRMQANRHQRKQYANAQIITHPITGEQMLYGDYVPELQAGDTGGELYDFIMSRPNNSYNTVKEFNDNEVFGPMMNQIALESAMWKRYGGRIKGYRSGGKMTVGKKHDSRTLPIEVYNSF